MKRTEKKPEKPGVWVYVGNAENRDLLKCSLCGGVVSFPPFTWAAKCPHCGANMNGVGGGTMVNA